MMLILFTLIFSTSCVETVVLGSAATGVVVVREKTAANTAKDLLIATKLTAKFIANGLKNPGNSIEFNVDEGRVLLTGIARNVKKANLASELAWKISDVKEVIDEIQLREDSVHFRDISSAAADYAITTTIETKLLFNHNIPSVNYQITTVDGVVYLLGVASNQRELDYVLSVISKIRGVEKVINHAILLNDPRRRHG